MADKDPMALPSSQNLRLTSFVQSGVIKEYNRRGDCWGQDHVWSPSHAGKVAPSAYLYPLFSLQSGLHMDKVELRRVVQVFGALAVSQPLPTRVMLICRVTISQRTGWTRRATTVTWNLPIRSIDFYYPEFQATNALIFRDKSKFCFLESSNEAILVHKLA